MGVWSTIRAALGQPNTRPPYDAATQGRRGFSLLPTGIGPTGAIAAGGEAVRARSHQLLRNNPWAYGITESFTANAVGTGIKVRSQHPDPAVRKALNELFEDWTDEADADGVNDFYGLQTVATQGLRAAGDVFIRFRPRRLSDGLTVPLQLQLLAGEFCPYWKTEELANGNQIICGVEFNPLGQRVAYHLFRQHPGDIGLTGFLSSPSETVRVQASQVLHLFRRRIPNQLRGEQAMARALLRMNDLDEYDNAELQKQKGAAYIGGVTVAPDPDKLPPSLGEVGDDDGTGGVQLTVGPLTWPVLPPGYQIQNFEPPAIGASDVFIRHQLRAIAQAGDVTYEQATGDMTGVNYSSARVALLEHRRRLEPWIWQVLVFQFCRPLWRTWLDAAVAAAAVDVPGYAEKPRDARRVTWYPQGWPWVDPLHEAEAAKMMVRCGFKSREGVISEMGYDPEIVEAQIVAENMRADAAGLVFDTDPRLVMSAGAGGAGGALEPGAAAPDGGGPAKPPAGGAKPAKPAKPQEAAG